MTVADRLMGAVQSGRGSSAADALCRTCVDVLTVDAVSLSLVFDGLNSGTLGTSGEQATVYDEVQFTHGQGPCLEAVATRGPILVDDVDSPTEERWPAYRAALRGHHVRAVFAFPVMVAGVPVAALDLFRREPGPLTPAELETALMAAELAAMPVLDVAGSDLDGAMDPDGTQWNELHALTRVEVAQATGMLVAQLDVDPVHALVRLRAHAYATGRSTTEVAHDIVNRVLRLEPDPPDEVR